MKHRYIVRTYVEAETIEEAIKLAKRTKPHDVYLDQDVWKDRQYALKYELKPKLGFK